jgi:dihydrolipoamide dehydrogenase
MPSKALIESANAHHRRNHFAELGIHGADSLGVDVSQVLRRVRRLRDGFTKEIVAITTELGDKSIAGRARFVAPDALDVNGRRIAARTIIVATGSRPVVPAAWTSFNDRVLTTDTLFERPTLPRRIGVIGIGTIGTEMSQALARLGLVITAFGSSARVAGLTDPEVSAALLGLLQGELAVHLGHRATLESGTGGSIRVVAGAESIEVDCVLAALGRQPNIDDLGLEHLGVELNANGLPAFDTTTRQVGDLPVYIAGDAANEFPVLHEAADDGYIAGTNVALDIPTCFQRRAPLAIVFCDPNVAIVGKSYAELDHSKIVVGTVSYARQGRATLAAENRGLLRVYAARPDGKLVGAELCAPRGEHLAHLLALAISQHLTVQDLLRMPFYHPVYEEGLRTALRDASKQLELNRQSDLANCNAVGATALD